MAIKAPHPATGDSLAHETNAAHVWIAIVQTGSIYMSESQEVHFRLLFDFEQQDELEKANSTSSPEIQLGVDLVELAILLASLLA